MWLADGIKGIPDPASGLIFNISNRIRTCTYFYHRVWAYCVYQFRHTDKYSITGEIRTHTGRSLNPLPPAFGLPWHIMRWRKVSTAPPCFLSLLLLYKTNRTDSFHFIGYTTDFSGHRGSRTHSRLSRWIYSPPHLRSGLYALIIWRLNPPCRGLPLEFPSFPTRWCLKYTSSKGFFM